MTRRASANQLPLSFEAPTVPLTGDFVLVPHSIFLSWTPEQQLRYCARRDVFSSIEAEEEGFLEEAAWLDERGAIYLMTADQLKRGE